MHTLWSIDSQENCKISKIGEMSYFKAKMYQIRFMQGLRLQRSPRPLAVFKGPTSKGREGKEGRGEGKAKERVGEGKRWEGCPPIGECESVSEYEHILTSLVVKILA